MLRLCVGEARLLAIVSRGRLPAANSHRHISSLVKTVAVTLTERQTTPTNIKNSPFLRQLLSDAILWARHVGSFNRRREGGYISNKPKESAQRKPSAKKGGASTADEGEGGGDGGGEGKGAEDQEPMDENERKAKEFARKYTPLMVGVFTAVSLYLITNYLSGPPSEDTMSEISWDDFVKRVLPRGNIRKIVINEQDGIAYIYSVSGTEHYRLGIKQVDAFPTEVRAEEVKLNLSPERWAQIEKRQPSMVGVIITLAVLSLFAIPIIFAFRQMKSFKMTDMFSSMMKSQVNIIDPHSKGSKLKIKFKDVAGLKEAKVEISEFVDYLRRPEKYVRLGARLPKGALLTGPPGCGKTLLAKALAAESSAPFISMNGTEFIEMIGGLGASRMRNLFKAAKERAPCIIYIDEIDAIGRRRSDTSYGGGSGEEEQTLNQLLVEMDGMDSAQGVIVIGSTNRPDILDKALLRPGRFDRHISCDLPTVLERQELFELYLKQIKIENRVMHFAQRLAQMTPSFSGADIRNVVNEAAIRAATNQQKYATLEDLDHSLQKILAGPEKRSQVLVKEEREVVAYHESGHALVGWLLEHTDALLKISIIPRTSAALGFSQHCTKERKLFTKEELFDRMCMMLGGRAAEATHFNRVTTGATNDLEKVTKQAYAQVRIYGMSDVVGPMSFPPTAGDERSSEFMLKPYSKHFHRTIDLEVNNLVSSAYDFTAVLLKKNHKKLETLAQALLERETLSYDDVKALIGPPPFGDKSVVDLVDHELPDPKDI